MQIQTVVACGARGGGVEKQRSGYYAAMLMEKSSITPHDIFEKIVLNFLDIKYLTSLSLNCNHVCG